jgi:hypothetical protein
VTWVYGSNPPEKGVEHERRRRMYIGLGTVLLIVLIIILLIWAF